MIRNYLLTALRNFRKNLTFSLVNIVGLAVGLTCFVFIAVFVFDELSYDTYPVNAKNIYRVNLGVIGNGSQDAYPIVDHAVGAGMHHAFGEIKSFTTMTNLVDFIKYEDKQFKENQLAIVDSNFLNFFSIALVDGNSKDALVAPNSIVVTKGFASRYFGTENALGKTVLLKGRDVPLKITGIINEVPKNSHFHREGFVSRATFPVARMTWSNVGRYTYLELNDGVDPKKLEAKFPQLVAKYVVPEVQHDMGISLAEAQKTVNTFLFTLFPLSDIHLYSHTKFEIEENGDIQYVYIFSALAVFVLLLACVNFTNLSVARSIKRAKEVGVRKVMGSGKLQLIKQFLSESVLMSFGAMLIAVVLISVLLPYFNQLSGKSFEFDYFLDYRFIIAAIVLLLFVGITAGIYPSFFLSAFNPVRVLKGSAASTTNKSPLRSGLVIFQFFVSTALICSTFIVSKQLSYMQNKKLGYDKEQVLFMPDARLLGANQDAFREELLRDSRVLGASISQSVPGEKFMGGTQVYPVNENGNGSEVHMNIYQVDYNYIPTLGMTMQKGRNFSKDFGSDSMGVIINEASVRELGWTNTDPIGKSIVRSGQKKYTVVGVVNDFHYSSAKEKIAPLMMLLGNNYGGMIVKIKTKDVNSFLESLKQKWDASNADGPFRYSFLDDNFESLYASETRIQQIFSTFSIVAIVIACLGLFGLSAFTIEQRTKEIGIRKVLGASVNNVLLMISKDFLKLVSIAFLISIPVTYWAMHQWLESYAYRTEIGVTVFALTGISAIVIAILAISFQAIKASIANPIRSLRSE